LTPFSINFHALNEHEQSKLQNYLGITEKNFIFKFITTNGDYEFLQRHFSKGIEKIHSPIQIPRALTIEQLQNDTPVKIAIINGFGNGIGTTVQGISSLLILKKLLLQREVQKIDFTVYLRKSNTDQYTMQTIIQLFEFLQIDIKFLPLALNELEQYHYIINNEAFLNHQDFSKLPTCDYFLKKYNINSDFVQEDEKNNHFLKEIIPKRNNNIDKLLESLNQKKTIFFHPLASNQLRSMPLNIAQNMIETLISHGYTVLSSVSLKCQHKNFIDMSNYTHSFLDFVYLISKMSQIITVGTSVYHISAAFHIKTILLPTVFTDITNAKIYPYVKTYLLTNIQNHPEFNSHKSHKDKSSFKKLWTHINYMEILSLLED